MELNLKLYVLKTVSHFTSKILKCKELKVNFNSLVLEAVVGKNGSGLDKVDRVCDRDHREGRDDDVITRSNLNK
jgi:hypothetical protein